MGRKPKQIYTATPEDNIRIREWMDKEGQHNNKLMLQILEFYFGWIFEHNRKEDSIYHNSIYRILVAIGEKPLTDKEKQNEER